ncbi:MAG: GNAT family N-acetyltransferase [Chloroflexia bacterium]
MVDEFEAAGEGYPYNNIELARCDFAAFVRELEDEERGVGLPPGVFPQITFVLVLAGRTALGEIRFRPSVAPAYGPSPDHIGYNIRPTARRKGFGGRQLALVLDEARALGLPGVRLAVEGVNPASAAIILKHGGVLLPRPDDAQAARVALY